MLYSDIEKIDRKISEYFSRSNNPLLKRFFSLVTHLGDGPLWSMVYAFIFFIMPDQFNPLFYALVSAEIIGLTLIIPLRYLTGRKRPDRNYTSVIPWNNYSFPSHHSLRAFIIAAITGTHFPHLLLILFSAALVISFSRIYLLRHFTSDVLAGAILGVITAGISLKLF